MSDRHKFLILYFYIFPALAFPPAPSKSQSPAQAQRQEKHSLPRTHAESSTGAGRRLQAQNRYGAPSGESPAPSPSFPVNKSKKRIIFLEKGESRILPAPSSEAIWLNKGGIVSVHDIGHAIRLRAKKEGEALLNTGGARSYRIYVLNEENKKHVMSLKELLSHRMGLKIQVVSGQIQIHGRLYRLKDFADLAQWAREHDLNYSFAVTVPLSLRPLLRSYIQSAMSQTGPPSLNIPPPGALKDYEKSSKNLHNIPCSRTVREKTERIFSSHIPEKDCGPANQPFTLLWKKPLTALLPDNASFEFHRKKFRKMGIAAKKDTTLLPSPPLVKIKVLLAESAANRSFQTHIGWDKSHADKTRSSMAPHSNNIVTRILTGDLLKSLLSDFKAMED